MRDKPATSGSLASGGRRWSLVAPVARHDEGVLKSTLLASPAIDGNCQVILRRQYPSAGKAYNSGLAEAQHDIVVFAHADVYLPAHWPALLGQALDALEAAGARWGVLGCFGATRETPPRLDGYCYSTGLRSMLGGPLKSLLPAQSLDELLLVVRRSSGLRFDEELPGFHLYGTDICLEAAARGLESYIIPAFCVHNSNGVVRLSHDFWRAYFYLRRKWRTALPVTTCCTTITPGCMPMLHRLAVEWKERILPREVGRRCDHVSLLYEQLCRVYPQLCAEAGRN